jgi:hypothetical protein
MLFIILILLFNIIALNRAQYGFDSAIDNCAAQLQSTYRQFLPTNAPTNSPTTASPTGPTAPPTNRPSNTPTRQPTSAPTNAPTNAPIPTIDPVGYTAGSDSFGAYTEVAMGFQSVASFYASQIPGTPPPIIGYLSASIPWCTTKVTVSCSNATFIGLSKSSQCRIFDWDPLGQFPLKGRLLVIPDPVRCGPNAIIYVRLYGVSFVVNPPPVQFAPLVQPPQIFTFQRSQLLLQYQNATRKTPDEYIFNYRNTTCTPIRGSQYVPPFPFRFDQDELVCSKQDFLLYCPTPRPYNSVDLNEIPTLDYVCINDNQRRTIWAVGSYHEPVVSNSVNYKFTACNGSFFTTACKATNPANVYPFLLDSGTVIYDDTIYTSLGYVAVVSYVPRSGPEQGQNVDIQQNAIYPLAVDDPIASRIPCFCGLAVICNENGNIPIRIEFGIKYLWPDNQEPIANIGLNFQANSGNQLVLVNSTNKTTLYGNLSYDPDNLPYLLVSAWGLYSKPNNTGPIDIGNPLVVNLVLDTVDYAIGNYTFILWVGDAQATAYALSVVTITSNLITCDIEPTIEVPFISFNSSSCPLSLNSSSSILLDASTCRGTNESIPLHFQWIQLAGGLLNETTDNITNPNNTFNCTAASVPGSTTGALVNQNNQVAYFTTPFEDTFTFELSVCDGENCLFVYVDYVVSQQFVRPVDDTNTTITNPPTDPAENLTTPPVPTSEFPNATDSPTEEPGPVAPFAPTPPPPSGLFPYWPHTWIGNVLTLFSILLGVIILILLIGYMLSEDDTDAPYDIIVS